MSATEVPEDSDEGFRPLDFGTERPSQGCTNGGISPCNCITIYGNGLYVSRIVLTSKTHKQYSGRWKLNRNGNLFVRSALTVLVPTQDEHEWAPPGGWFFDDGDLICGGFWYSTGEWHDTGCAQEEIQG